jgi:hypothetical protein
LRAILVASALHDRGSANISKLPGLLKPREEKDPGALAEDAGPLPAGRGFPNSQRTGIGINSAGFGAIPLN